MSDYKGSIAPVGEVTLQDLINDLDFNPKQGAVTTFTGLTRELSDQSGKQVVRLEVEAWEDQTSESMNKIATEIGRKYNLLGMRIVHLEGEIPIGQPIVFIVISSVHRKEAFAALEDAINRYKNESPVWKKEIYSDGTGKWISTKNK